MKLQLKDQNGQVFREASLPLGGNGLKIGRSTSCEVYIPSNSLAEEHVIIRMGDDGRVLLQDLQSSFGIVVEGERLPPGFLRELKPRQSVALSDEITLTLDHGRATGNGAGAAQPPEKIPNLARATIFPFFVERNTRQVRQIFTTLRSRIPRSALQDLMAAESAIHEKVRELSSLIDVSFALTSVTSYGRLLEYVVDMALEATGADFGRLVLHNEEMDRLETMIMRRLDEKLPPRDPKETERFVLECFHGRDVIIRSPADQPTTTAGNARTAVTTLAPPRPIALVPLRVHGVAIGVLQLERQQSDQPFSPTISEPLRVFATHASLAIGHARLTHLATIDELTGLTNYSHLQQRLLEEFARSRRHSYPLSLVLVEIDEFERFRERHGPALSDLVIRKVGRLLKSAMRVHDLAARYGSQEFAVLLPATDAAGAVIVADKLLQLVREAKFKTGKKNIKVTASIGLAALNPNHAKPMDLFSESEAALAEARAEGGDQVAGGNAVIQMKAPLAKAPATTRGKK